MHLYYLDKSDPLEQVLEMAFVLQATKSIQGGAPWEKNSLRMQFKNTRLFFSRAEMTHYPGSKAGSPVSWVVPQYSDTQIAPSHHLQCYSHLGQQKQYAHKLHRNTNAHIPML